MKIPKKNISKLQDKSDVESLLNNINKNIVISPLPVTDLFDYCKD